METYMNVLRTIIVPAALVENAKKLGSYVDAHGEGMFTTALSPSGNLPATHYISSGVVDEAFAAIMEDGDMLDAAATAGAQKHGKSKATSKQAALDLVANSTVHEGSRKYAQGNDINEGPHELIARLGLKIINPPL